MADFKKRLTLTGAELPTALPHCFYVHSYRSPTKCHVCKRLLKGLVKQGYRCKGTRRFAHFLSLLSFRLQDECAQEMHSESDEELSRSSDDAQYG